MRATCLVLALLVGFMVDSVADGQELQPLFGSYRIQLTDWQKYDWRVVKFSSNADLDRIEDLGSLGRIDEINLTSGFCNHDLQPRHIRMLQGVQGLKQVSLARNHRVVDDHLEPLSQIGTLETINLTETEVTDAGVRLLARLPKLKTLRLAETGLDGSCFASFSRVSLTKLILNEAPISGEGLRSISRIKSLEWLDLNLVSLPAAEITHLRHCSNLRALGFWGVPELDSHDLSWLPELRQLQSLSLGNSSVDDSIIETLSRCTELKLLDLNNTRVSEKGIQKLSRLLPECEILTTHDFPKQ